MESNIRGISSIRDLIHQNMARSLKSRPIILLNVKQNKQSLGFDNRKVTHGAMSYVFVSYLFHKFT